MFTFVVIHVQPITKITIRLKTLMRVGCLKGVCHFVTFSNGKGMTELRKEISEISWD